MISAGRLLQVAFASLVTALSVQSCLHPTPQPPQPLPVRPVVVWVQTAAGALEGAQVAYGGFSGATAADGHVGFDLPQVASHVNVAVLAAGFQPYSQEVDLPTGPAGVDLCVCQAPPPGMIALSPLRPLVQARKGWVRLRGRAWLDDDGDFRPLGATLMWALYGWHEGDRARVEQQLAHLRDHRFDSVRILAEVGWPGETIDPRWPDYDDTLTSFIDAAYDAYGLRTELTIIGGGTGYNPVVLAQRLVGLLDGRQHKILYAEMSNEMQSMDAPTARKMIDVLRPLGVILIPSNCDRIGCDLTQLVAETGADAGAMHLDRDLTSPLDYDWRQVRQPWEASRVNVAVALNEPVGPRSSIEENIDPLQLAMYRLDGIISGAGAYVLHNGAGVSGRVDPYHNRPANLWEVPGIDAIEDAVRSVDRYIPIDAENWRKANTSGAPGQWVDNPLIVDGVWPSDGGDHGVVRLISAYSDREFVSLALGARNAVTITSRWSADVTVTKFSGEAGYGSPMTTETVSTNRPIAAGATFVLHGPPDAHAAYVVRGMR